MATGAPSMKREQTRTELEDTVMPMANDRITIAVLSDRLVPLQAMLGSILLHTNASLDFIVIGENVEGLRTQLQILPFKEHQQLIVVSMDQAAKEIRHMNPPWLRPTAGQSIDNATWLTNWTILQREWDHDSMHHLRFNIMRFYLAHLPMLSEVNWLLLMDDDIILKSDITGAQETPLEHQTDPLHGAGLTCHAAMFTNGRACADGGAARCGIGRSM
jgi:hypothetical protein